jgi:hypothetical protein
MDQCLVGGWAWTNMNRGLFGAKADIRVELGLGAAAGLYRKTFRSGGCNDGIRNSAISAAGTNAAA